MSIATGGKVWTIPAYSKIGTPVRSGNQWGKFMLRFLPMALPFPIAAVVFGFKFIEATPSGYKSIAGGYVKDYLLTPSLWPLAAIVVIALLTYLSFKLSDRFMGISFMSISAGPLIAMTLMFAAFIFTGVSTNMKNQSFPEWAKTTYGYTAVESITKTSTLTMATNKDGDEIQVGVYRFQNNVYLYEDLAQLDTLKTRINTELENK